MNKNQINKYLSDKIGNCNHIFTIREDDGKLISIVCEDCKEPRQPRNDGDFYTWEGFGILWEWAKEQKWWLDFISTCNISYIYPEICDVSYIDPEVFANKVYTFLTDEEAILTLQDIVLGEPEEWYPTITLACGQPND